MELKNKKQYVDEKKMHWRSMFSRSMRTEFLESQAEFVFLRELCTFSVCLGYN